MEELANQGDNNDEDVNNVRVAVLHLRQSNEADKRDERQPGKRGEPTRRDRPSTKRPD